MTEGKRVPMKGNPFDNPELLAVMMKCEHCDGTGWVCEYHRDRPWDGHSNRDDACGCGSGVPCPVCIPEGEHPPFLPGTEFICTV